MEKLHPSEIDLGLQRVQTVAKRLGISAARAKVVTVAGTNGKGSCISTMEQLLCAAGTRVGAYTSPHIRRFNERIKVNGECIDDDALCSAFEKIDVARADTSLTYFEFATLAAFLIFEHMQLDYWLCEVGLGGRLDAVNIIDPDIAVITSIDLDHQQWLGDTREKIAYEKLGIVRHGGICICAEANPTANMWEIFAERKLQVYQIGRDFSFNRTDNDKRLANHTQDVKQDRAQGRWQFSVLNAANTVVTIDVATIHLPEASVAAALQVLALDPLPIAPGLIRQRLPQLRLAGRFERRQLDGVPVVLDVAHNPAAAARLARQLADVGARSSVQEPTALQAQDGAIGPMPVIAVLAMMADKCIAETLSELGGLIHTWHLGQFPTMPRSASSASIAEMLQNRDTHAAAIHVHTTITQAFEAAMNTALTLRDNNSSPMILVFGSFFTVAEVEEHIDALTQCQTSEKKENG